MGSGFLQGSNIWGLGFRGLGIYEEIYSRDYKGLRFRVSSKFAAQVLRQGSGISFFYRHLQEGLGLGFRAQGFYMDPLGIYYYKDYKGLRFRVCAIYSRGYMG